MSTRPLRRSPAPRPAWAPGLTEALLEADSSSALGGCVAFFRLRGLDSAAFRRLLGGLAEESSYSSAREKRSLNLGQGGALSALHPAPHMATWPRALSGFRTCTYFEMQNDT